MTSEDSLNVITADLERIRDSLASVIAQAALLVYDPRITAVRPEYFITLKDRVHAAMVQVDYAVLDTCAEVVVVNLKTEKGGTT